MAQRSASDSEIIRGILNRIGESDRVNQRALANEMGIALGLINAYVKRCVRKGYVKVSQVPPNRYLYYLTPHGFAEKSRLTAEFMSDSLTFFRRARTQYDEIFNACQSSGWRRLGFSGISELGEIAALYARDRDLEPIGIVDAAQDGERFMGMPVVGSIDGLSNPDAVIITSVAEPQRAYDDAVAALGATRVMAPPLLSIDRNGQPVAQQRAGDD